ncbi:MAG: low specificity L-threonine aldolase [Actinomycetes bacterium]
MTGASFASDNHAGAHPDVLAAVVAANEGFAPAYGDDDVTANAVALLREQFGADVEVFPVFNGTGANVVALQSMVRPFEAVLCASTAHINVDECGAPERFLGSKLIDIDVPEGKLTVAALEAAVFGLGDPHHVQTRAVSLTQSTELGTVYSLAELREITSWAHGRGFVVHLDGARIANAAASLGVGLGELGVASGVDLMSFGATKNGALGVEAVLVLNPALAESMHFIRKQSMQLASKMRFLSAQLVALLTDDLWLRNATHANAMATRLAAAVGDVVEISYPVQANAVFAMLDPASTAVLQEQFPFYVWNESTGQVRWMTSWRTTESDVDTFATLIRTTLPT